MTAVATLSAIDVAWAKTANRGRESDRPGEPYSFWLPLWRHLADTAGIAELLWEHWVPRQQVDSLVAVTGWREDQLRHHYAYLAGVHDVGKATSRWSHSRLAGTGGEDTIVADMVAAGLPMPTAAVPPRDLLAMHDALGWAWLVRQASGSARRALASSLVPVACHHGNTQQISFIRSSGAVLSSDAWEQVRRSVIPVQPLAELADLPPLPPAAQVMLTGLVTMADWIASNTELFPLVPVGTQPPEGSERVREAWERLQAPGFWSPQVLSEPHEAMTSRFAPEDEEWAARPVQETVVDLCRTIPAGSLIIVEDQMGQGKTEAALLAAETLAARSGARGVVFALPTMATADSMLDRSRRWTERIPGARLTTSLSHSRANLNSALVTGRDDSWWWADEGATARKLFDGLVVTTIDKVLQMALRTKRVMLNHSALTGKVVILDEVHSADPYMLVFLRRALRWLGAYGVPVIALSATLPQHVRDSLLQAYSGDPSATVSAGGYPRVTHIGPGRSADVVLPEQPEETTTVSLRYLDDREDPTALPDLLRERLSDGGVAAVVCTTVRRAQETYAQLRLALGHDTEVVLHHSRYVAARRSAMDDSLKTILGKGGPRPERMVVVATQVIEQSLDIDFDLMVTDPAPVDLILQRIGRLHRHSRSRPPKLTDPVCYLRGFYPDSGKTLRDTGAAFIYGAGPVRRALAVLTARGHLSGKPLTLPSDIPALVDDAYGSTPSVPDESWRDRITRDDEAMDYLTGEREQRATEFLAPEPVAGADLHSRHWAAPQQDERTEDTHPTVRDGDSGPEVIVIDGSDGWRVPDVHGVPLAGRRLNPDKPLPRKVATELARSMLLRTPQNVALSDTREVPAEWDRGPLRGQRLLVLGPGMQLGRMSYTEELGLFIAKKER